MDTKHLQERADALNIVPRMDALEEMCAFALKRWRNDAQLAPIWAEKLRHTYTRVLEIEYPDLLAASGGMFDVDTSVDPAALETEYHTAEATGFADWIDDDGQVAPGSALKAKRYTAVLAELGHAYDLNFFDLERASKASFPLAEMKQKAARRAIEAAKNWVWLFGDSGKGIFGLCNHPNISRSVAALNDGATSRRWVNKTNEEIIADVVALIDRIPEDTLEQEHAATVYMPSSLIRLCRARKLSSGTAGDSGMASLWDFIQSVYSGDESGQGKVEFKALFEAAANRRVHPKTGADESGISGDFLIAVPARSDETMFVQARPFTQRVPEERGFVLYHTVHAKIGGVKLQKPLAVHRMDFGLV